MKLASEDVIAMSDEQKLVVLEALVVGVLADGKVEPEEVKRFDEVVGTLPWGLDKAVLAALVTQTQQRVSSLPNAQAVTDFVINMAARIPTATLRDKVFFTMCTIMAADGDVNRLEKAVIGVFVLAFGITSDRLAAIKTAIIGRVVAAEAVEVN